MLPKLKRWWRDGNRHWLNDVYYIESDGSIKADLDRLFGSKRFWEQLEACERVFEAQRRCPGEIVNPHVSEYVAEPSRFPLRRGAEHG